MLDNLCNVFKSSQKSLWKDKKRDSLVEYLNRMINLQNDEIIQQQVTIYENGIRKNVYSREDSELLNTVQKAKEFLSGKSYAQTLLSTALSSLEANQYNQEQLLYQLTEAIACAKKYKSLSESVNEARSALEYVKLDQQLQDGIKAAKESNDTSVLETILSRNYKPIGFGNEGTKLSKLETYQKNKIEEAKRILLKTNQVKPIVRNIQSKMETLDRVGLEEISKSFIEYERLYPECTFLIRIIDEAKKLIREQKLAMDIVNRNLISSRQPHALSKFSQDYNHVLSPQDLSQVQRTWTNTRYEDISRALNGAITDSNVRQIELQIAECENLLLEGGEFDKKAELLNLMASGKNYLNRLQNATDELQQSLASGSISNIEASIVRASSFPPLAAQVIDAKSKLAILSRSEYYFKSLTDYLQITSQFTDHNTQKENFAKLKSVVQEVLDHINVDDLMEENKAMQPLIETAIKRMEQFEHEEHVRNMLIRTMGSDDLVALEHAIDQAKGKDNLKNLIVQANITLQRKKKEIEFEEKLNVAIERRDFGATAKILVKCEKFGSLGLANIIKRAKGILKEQQEAITALEKSIDSGIELNALVELAMQYKGLISENDINRVRSKWHERRRTKLVHSLKRSLENQNDEFIADAIRQLEQELSKTDNAKKQPIEDAIQLGKQWLKTFASIATKLKNALQEKDEKKITEAFQESLIYKSNEKIELLREKANSIFRDTIYRAQLSEQLNELIHAANVQGIEQWIETANKIKHVDLPRALSVLTTLSRQIPLRDRLLALVEAKERKRLEAMLDELQPEDEKSPLLTNAIAKVKKFISENERILLEAFTLLDSKQIKKYIHANQDFLAKRDIDSIWNKWRSTEIKSYIERLQSARNREDDTEIFSVIEQYNQNSAELLLGVIDTDPEDDALESLIRTCSAFVLEKRETTQALKDAVSTKEISLLEASIERSENIKTLATQREEAIQILKQVRLENEMLKKLEDCVNVLQGTSVEEVPKVCVDIKLVIKQSEELTVQNRRIQSTTQDLKTLVQKREHEHDLHAKLKEAIASKELSQLKSAAVSECEKLNLFPKLVSQAMGMADKQIQVITAAKVFTRTATKVQLEFFLEEHNDVLPETLVASIEKEWKIATRKNWIATIESGMGSNEINMVNEILLTKAEMLRETKMDSNPNNLNGIPTPIVTKDEVEKVATKAEKYLKEVETARGNLRKAIGGKQIEPLEKAIQNYFLNDEVRAEAYTLLQKLRYKHEVISSLEQALPSRDISVLRNSLKKAIESAAHDPDLFIGSQLESLKEKAIKAVETRLEEESSRATLLKAVREKDRVKLETVIPKYEKIQPLQSDVYDAKMFLQKQKVALSEFDGLLATAKLGSELDLRPFDVLPNYDIDDMKNKWYNKIEQLRLAYEKQLQEKKEPEPKSPAKVPLINLQAALQEMFGSADGEGSPKTASPASKTPRGLNLTEVDSPKKTAETSAQPTPQEKEKLEKEKRIKQQRALKEKKSKELQEKKLKEEQERERLEKEKQEAEEKAKKEKEEKEKAAHEEKARLEQEAKEKAEREEQEKKAKEEKEQREREIQEEVEKIRKGELHRQEQERVKRERLERYKAEKERQEKEKREKEEREEKERKEQEEKERRERVKAEKERIERERKERDEKIKREKEEKERKEREQREQEEREKLELERIEREKREKIERERKERERVEREERERAEQEERERRERKEREERKRREEERRLKEEQERVEEERREREEEERRNRVEKERRRREKERRERERREREERERREREEQEAYEREEEERRQLERERKRRETEERAKAERERIERERERIERERKQVEEERIRMEQEKLMLEEERLKDEQRRKHSEELMKLEKEKLEKQRLLLEQEANQADVERIRNEIEQQELKMKEQRDKFLEEEKLELERKRELDERLKEQREQDRKRKEEFLAEEKRLFAQQEEERRLQAQQREEEERKLDELRRAAAAKREEDRRIEEENRRRREEERRQEERLEEERREEERRREAESYKTRRSDSITIRDDISSERNDPISIRDGRSQSFISHQEEPDAPRTPSRPMSLPASNALNFSNVANLDSPRSTGYPEESPRYASPSRFNRTDSPRATDSPSRYASPSRSSTYSRREDFDSSRGSAYSTPIRQRELDYELNTSLRADNDYSPSISPVPSPMSAYSDSPLTPASPSVPTSRRKLAESRMKKEKIHPVLEKLDQSVAYLIHRAARNNYEELEELPEAEEDLSLPKCRYCIRTGFDANVVAVCKHLNSALQEGIIPPRLLIDSERTPYSIIKACPGTKNIAEKFDSFIVTKQIEADSFTKNLFFVAYILVSKQSSMIIKEMTTTNYVNDVYDAETSLLRNTERKDALLYQLRKVEKVFDMPFMFEFETERSWELIEDMVGDATQAHPLTQVRSLARLIIQLSKKSSHSRSSSISEESHHKRSGSMSTDEFGRRKSLISSLKEDGPTSPSSSPPRTPRTPRNVQDSPRSPRNHREPPESPRGEKSIEIQEIFKKKFSKALTLVLEDGFKSFKLWGRYYIWDAFEWTFKTTMNDEKEDLKRMWEKIGKSVDTLGDKVKEPAEAKFVLLLCDSFNKGKLRKRIEIIFKDQPTMDGFYATGAMVRDDGKRAVLLNTLDSLAKTKTAKIPIQLEEYDLIVEV